MSDDTTKPTASLGETFEVLAFGRFAPEQLRVVHNDAPRESCDELECLIAKEWEHRFADAQKRGLLLFNGELFRYVDHRVDDSAAPVLELTVGPTCYRDFVGTNLYNHHRVTEFGWNRFSNPVGTTATITTSDGRIVYGRRSDRVAYHAGHVHTFGGSLESQDRGEDGTVDVFGSLRRELHEELHMGEGEIDSIHAIGIVRDREIVQPELLFEMHTPLSFDQVVCRWETAEARDEHAELVCMDESADALVPFIQNCGLIAPVAVAALLLYGLHRWGQDWYRAAGNASHRS